MKSIHMLLASVAVLVAPTTAVFAQDGEVVQDEAAVPAEEVYSDNEIIVSATRRDQVAQDVPLAVSVVGGEQLANAAAQLKRTVAQQLTQSSLTLQDKLDEEEDARLAVLEDGADSDDEDFVVDDSDEESL